MLKTFSNSRKSSPSRTPVKKQKTKVQSLLDPARLRPPPMTSPRTGELIGPNTRMNIAVGLQQQQQQHLRRSDDDEDENEIMSISFSGTGGGAESSLV